MKKITKKNKMSTGKKIALGAGAVGIGATAYYLFGPKSKEHQKKARKVLSEVKGAIEKKLQTIERNTQPIYHSAVDTLAKTYNKKYKAHEGEINAFIKKIKGEWGTAKRTVRPIVKKVTRKINKVA